MLSDIKKLIPFVCENFLTFPLLEDGDFRPRVNVWLTFKKLPAQIIDAKKIDLLKLDCKKFAQKDFFDVYPTVKKHESFELEFFGQKIETYEYYHVQFEISNAREFDKNDHLYIDELVFIANSILDYFEHVSDKA